MTMLVSCAMKSPCPGAKSSKTRRVHSVRKQLGSIVAIVSQSAPPFFWETSGPELHELAIQIKYVIYGVPLLEFFLCFSSCIFSGAVSLQLHSSCKFQLQILFTLGEAFAGAKKSQQSTSRLDFND